MEIMLELDRNMNCVTRHRQDRLFEKAMDSFARAINGDNKNYTSHNLDLPNILDLFVGIISMIARHLRHSSTIHGSSPRSTIKQKFSKRKKYIDKRAWSVENGKINGVRKRDLHFFILLVRLRSQLII